MTKEVFSVYLGEDRFNVTAEYTLLEPDPVYFAEVYLEQVKPTSFSDILSYLTEEAQEAIVTQIMEQLSDRHNENL
jgi:hypothetical protein